MIKYTLIYGLLTLVLGCAAQVSNEEKTVKSTILAFMKAGDDSDANKLKELLNDNFRIVMNQLFGSDQVSTVDKSFYLSKIEAKEWGGDTRKVTIENLVITGKNASAKVTTVGTKSTMISLLHLIKDANCKWKIINDLPSLG